MGRLNHTPEWYDVMCERNGWEEKFHQNVSKMLKEDMNDTGGDFDPRLSDLENLGNYKEHYNTAEFINNVSREELDEVVFKDMQETDPGRHYIMEKGLAFGEEEYHKIVNECANNLMEGRDDKLIKYLKKIRKEAQRRINQKDIDKQKDKRNKLGLTDEMMPIAESPYHSWNRISGSKEDYNKELLNHKRASLLLEAVQIRMKELYERRCNNVKEKLLGREQRQIELEKIMSYPEISQEAFTGVSKHLKVSVQEQGNYLDEITGSNKED